MFSWVIPARQETLCKQRFLCCSASSPRKHTGKKLKVIDYIQNIYIWINSKLWKGGGIVLRFLLFFSSNLKKKEVTAVLILSRPVHKSQVINPHDILGCWILHLELWKTDSWKIYKIPGSQSAPYWLHIWGVPASCLAQRAACMGYIVLKQQALFSAMARAKIWSFGVCGSWLGTFPRRHGDNHRLGMPGACCSLLQNHTVSGVLGVQLSFHGRSNHKQ